MSSAYRQNSQGSYQRSHVRQASSISGFSVLPPLSVLDTLILQCRFAQQGLLDAFKIRTVVDSLGTNKIISGNIVKSSLLLLVVLFSALAIKPLLYSVIPYDRTDSQKTGGIVFVLFHVLWLYPLAVAAVFLSGILQVPLPMDRRSQANRGNGDYRGLTATLVTHSYKALVLANYLTVVFVLRYIPLIGGFLAFFYASLIDSYYCFEAQWIRQGWPLDERIKHLENRWAYFFGFGLPITLLSWWSSDPVVNLTLFSLFFPIYQLMTPSSLPQPLDPKLPTSAMSISFAPQQSSQGSFSMAAAEGGEEARGRRGSSYIPVRIRALGGADVVYGLLMKSFAGGKASRKKDANGPLPPLPPTNYDQPSSGGGGWRNDYGSAPSAYGSAPSGYGSESSAPPPPPVQPSGFSSIGRFGLGGVMGTTPPRRGHQMTESTVGVGGTGPGGEFEDRKLDNLINAAGRRKKGE